METHVDRNWGLILQQAWSFYLTERLPVSQVSAQQNKPLSGAVRKTGKNCFKYNQERCSYGFNCKFEHRCGLCMKYGHGAHNCRKANNVVSRDRYFDKDTGEGSFRRNSQSPKQGKKPKRD